MGMHAGLLRLVRTPCPELKRHLPLQNGESVCAEPIRNRSVQPVFCFCSYEWSWPNPSEMVGVLSCSLGQLRYLDRALWSLGRSRLFIISQTHKHQDLCCGMQIHPTLDDLGHEPRHRLVASGTSPAAGQESWFVHPGHLSLMDSQNRQCQDLSNQLAVYRAFNNRSATAAVLRQMASAQCPIGASKLH
jgi:hypothetical protein